MNEWVELLVTYDDTEVEIIRNILEAEGIDLVVNSLKVRPYPVSIGRMGEVKILVKKKDLNRAKELLNIMKGTDEQKGS
ncbi:hypothetical protein BMS3Abin10_01753 [bacterium BMS3Abin10]|nr:hypothetical protein BMS3Abin10_01753 [bacterium BMS3Abin10]GBE39102.1 hypothetical protein BMS3Bbin08_01720 [bacterium BMS3Bbin08]